MNFLSNIWGGVKNIASNVVSGVKNVYNAVAQTAKDSAAANVYSASNPSASQLNIPSPLQSLATTAKQAVTGSTSLLKPSNYISNPVRSATPPSSTLGQIMTPMPTNQYQTPLPSDFQAPNQQVQQSGQGEVFGAQTQGAQQYQTPYQPQYQSYNQQYDPQSGAGRVLTAQEIAQLAPKTANTDIFSTSSFSTPQFNNPLSALPRLAPFSGFSSFNGVTSAAGGASSSPVTSTPDAEEQRRKYGTGQTSIKGQQIMSPYLPGFMTPMPTGTGIQTPKPFNVPPPPSTVNAGALVSSKEKSTPIVSTRTSANDFNDLVGGIETGIQENYQKVSAQNPIPNEPVVETKDQSDFLQQFQPQERINIQQVMDDFRRQLQLPQLQQQQIDVQNQLNATNQTFSQIYDDILKNPNLPKGLAQRRLKEVQDQHKTRIDQLTGQLQIAGQQISNANSLINQQFQIVSATADEDYRARQENFNLLKFYTDSGAISSFAPEDISKWSQATGIPEGQLQAIQKASSKGDVKIVEGNDGAFYKQTIGKNGAVSIERITDPIVSASSTGTEMTPKQYSAFLSVTSKVQSDKYVNQLYEAVGADDIADQIIANPNNAQNQLKALYSLVKRLDPESAVREGELDLAQTSLSWLQKFETYGTRIAKGQVINPDVAVSMAEAVKELSSAWNKTANAKLQSYRAQSVPLGIASQFDEFVSGLGAGAGSSNNSNTSNSTQIQISEIAGLEDGSLVPYDGETYYKYGDELLRIDELFSPYAK